MATLQSVGATGGATAPIAAVTVTGVGVAAATYVGVSGVQALRKRRQMPLLNVSAPATDPECAAPATDPECSTPVCGRSRL